MPPRRKKKKSDSSQVPKHGCQYCKQGDDSEELLICDGCDTEYHTYCVGLKGVPGDEKWYCPECSRAQEASGMKSSGYVGVGARDYTNT